MKNINDITQDSGYISSSSGDIQDSSVFLTKALFLLTQENANLQTALWFPNKTEDPYKIFRTTAQLLYFSFTYTVSHFRDTKRYKLSEIMLKEIKDIVDAITSFFDRISKTSWNEPGPLNESKLKTMSHDMDTLIVSYLQALNLIGLHKIGITHTYINPEMAFQGSGTI